MKMCKNCHQVVNENEIFCHNCGFNEFDYITLQSEEERKKLQEEKKNIKKEKIKKIIKKVKIIILTIVIIYVIFYAVMLILGLSGVFDDEEATNILISAEANAIIKGIPFNHSYAEKTTYQIGN